MSAGTGAVALLLIAGCAGADDPGTADATGATGAAQHSEAPAGSSAAPDAGSGSDASTEDPADGEESASEAEASESSQAWQQQPAAQTRSSERTELEQVDYLTGGITPKSVVASGRGLLIANNMMYSHTSTVYDAATHELLTTLDDGVDLAEFGIEGHPGISQGAPVEAAWTDDGRYAYVSQYTMYGEGFGVQGFDACTTESGVGPSFLYRFDAEEMAWDQAIEVGAVPKYVEITPDQTRVLVSNWCDATVSVVDVEGATETGQIPLAAAPRGLEVMPDNRTAYAVAMYADTLYSIDLETQDSEVVMTTGDRPRHLNLTEDGRWLYLTVSGANTIFKLDTRTNEVVDQVSTGLEPRSVAMSADETALYVVNYDEASISKIRTSDMTVLQSEPVDANPIGITYDPVTQSVWVACYGGSLYVFDDSGATSEAGAESGTDG